MNAIADAQVWHRWLGHLHAQSSDILRKRDSTGITFEEAVSDCDVCAARKRQQLAYLKTANHDVYRPFQLCCGDLMVPFTPVAIGGYIYISKVIDEYMKSTTVYLLTSSNQALQSPQLFVGSTFIPFVDRIVRWCANKDSEFTGETFRQYCLGDRHYSRVRRHQYAAANRCVRTRGENSLHHGSLHTQRQRFSIVHVGRALHGGGVPQEQDSTNGAQEGDAIQNASRRGS